MKKALVLMTGLAVVSAAGLALAQAKPDFSGTWALDQEKSDPPPQAMGRGPGGPGGPGGGMRGDAPSLTITQTAKELKVEREGMGGGMITTAYALDGSESANSAGRGASKSKSRWAGATLVTEGSQTMETPRGEMTTEFKEVRSLSADGKTMTVETTRKTPRGETTRKLVYNKKTS